ncbi:galactose-3-O-sulfotransferase 2 [Phyllopteryx taeniolatus]|uniref:galactose-3-O-sulfotransferase 2 n=1 Tax=Phyllopteryx taeniolatus TaxID=161469 RepID=UPI002AD57D20|nr:galactose-3-O-sulfotransferase 2 [Phyllopteryx taeniolatus]
MLPDQPLSSVSLCMHRTLCRTHHFLWILLILLVVCIAIQTLVARQARYDELPHVEFTAGNEHVFPPLQNVGAEMEDVISAQTERNAKVHYQTEQNGKPETDIQSKYVDTTIFHSTGSQTKRVLPGKFLPLDDQNKLKTRHAVSLAPESDAKSFLAGKYSNHPNASSSSNAVKENNTTVYTERKCLPSSHIVFLKTHKTASSTILNILYRYGESRNLTFALPRNKQKQLFYPHFFASHFVEGCSSRNVKEFHIMCNHMRFRKAEVAKVMPADAFYFSIIRNPVAMMESIFIYYKSIPAFHKTQSLDDFLDNRFQNYSSSVRNNHYAHNILAFDFGFNNDVTAAVEDFEERTNRSIAAVEQDFHLILISEYFEESMILLKHSLCWSLDDVVSFKMNSRSERTRRPLLPTTAEKIKRWNALDWRIYMHFNRTFWHKVDTLIGREQMKVEVSHLKRLQAKLANTCLTDGGPVDPLQVKEARLKPFQYGAAVIQGYNLNPHIDAQTKTKCERLITPELQYTDRLYTQQFPKLAAKRRKARPAIQSQHSGITELARKALKRKAQDRHTTYRKP